jgi:hypothetical protein
MILNKILLEDQSKPTFVNVFSFLFQFYERIVNSEKPPGSDQVLILNNNCTVANTKFFPNSNCTSGWKVTSIQGERVTAKLDEHLRITCTGMRKVVLQYPEYITQLLQNMISRFPVLIYLLYKL